MVDIVMITNAFDKFKYVRILRTPSLSSDQPCIPLPLPYLSGPACDGKALDLCCCKQLKRVQSHHAHRHVCILNHLTELLKANLAIPIFVRLHHGLVHDLCAVLAM